jgi:uncharacterized protein YecT (DUF1311 family)
MKRFFLLFSIIVSFHAHAENPCDKAMSTQEINQCGQLEHKKSDAKLNSIYQAALKNIESQVDDEQQKKETKQGLIDAQRLWVKFRDKDCGAVYDYWKGGTVRGAMYWGCMISRTESRIKDLESFANGQH